MRRLPQWRGRRTGPESVGTLLAAVLKDRGADAILDQIREPAAR
jgi:hypothetical protein